MIGDHKFNIRTRKMEFKKTEHFEKRAPEIKIMLPEVKEVLPEELRIYSGNLDDLGLSQEEEDWVKTRRTNP
jgi:hypothetical protein